MCTQRFLLLGLLIARGETAHAHTTTSKKKPNLVFALVDDLGFNDGWADDSDLKDVWPHVRALPALSIETYYTQYLCTPTRAAFMTGRYPHRYGLHHNVLSGYKDYGLPLNETTLAEKLTRRGYKTIHVGKWHLGVYSNKVTAISRGFDLSFGYSNGMEGHFNHTTDDLFDLYLDSDYQTLGPSLNGTHGAFVFSAAAQKAITATTQPVFLYYALQDVHGPMEAPVGYVESRPACATIVCNDTEYTDTRRALCGMAAAADEAIGNVTDAIYQVWGGFDNTLLVIAGDNGGLVRQGGNNFPLRGQKSQPWEGGVRNRALFIGLGLIPGGVYRGVMHVVDLHATFLALAGDTASQQDDDDDDPPLDGIDLWPALLTMTSSTSSQRNETLLMYDPCSDAACSQEAWALRFGQYKAVRPGALNDSWHAPPMRDTTSGGNCTPCVLPPNVTEYDDALCSEASSSSSETENGALRPEFLPGPDGSVVVVARDDACHGTTTSVAVDPVVHLFDLEADPTERVDLAADRPDLVEYAQTRLAFYLEDEVAPCNIPNGTCNDDDPVGVALCAQLGHWRPWQV